ncbi:MAG TPA: thiamine pyrophosphate-dependent enzyme, partial [Roseiflexaceae bacterium]|nr:thiamine pyrophosphate-dependent enzyme [Roseiflexaceae bacterium]
SHPVVVDAAFARYPAFRPAPEPAAIERAARAIAAARRPVIVAGGGVRISAAAQELVALAEQLAIPVATSVNAKGTIPDDHPLGVGVVGSYSARCANQVVAEADLVIFVGSRTGDQVTHSWTVPTPGTAVVQVDIDPAEIGRSYPGAIGVVGDAKMALAALASALRTTGADESWLRRAQAHVRAWRAEIEPLRRSDALPIRPERLCAELSDALPEDAVLVADTGYATIWTATMVQLAARQTYLRAAGSLGWAFPAALGVKCAVPDRPVICFTGDGGFWYHMSELETARRHDIRTVTIINNNGGLAQGIDDIHAVYGGRPGNPEELYRFGPVSFARIAQELGCFGLRVERPGEIGAAIRQALAAEAPAVVEVITGLHYRAPEPWTPGPAR